MNLFKGNSKFLIIILLIFFGGGIMTIIDNFNYNENRTGIIYQENKNVVLSELNKSYYYNINYDLDESYLHYSPINKSGFLDNYNNEFKNLASPNLSGKKYLGNGEYFLENVRDKDITYNVYNGDISIVGPANRYIGYYNLLSLTIPNSNDYTLSLNTLQALRITIIVNDVVLKTTENILSTYEETFNFNKNDIVSFEIFLLNNFVYNNNITKVQIEQGTTATSYEVPYIPPLRIDFKGTNQVEYINPYEEQIIKINDIKNVSTIEFDLLNTKNNVVFNWNIKTNENLPFVKYYNEEHKLIYDFTDIEEINNTGDILISNKGLLLNTIRNTFDLIDMFYSGFQKLFSKKDIDNLINIMKKAWPAIIPKWPWVRS